MFDQKQLILSAAMDQVINQLSIICYDSGTVAKKIWNELIS